MASNLLRRYLKPLNTEEDTLMKLVSWFGYIDRSFCRSGANVGNLQWFDINISVIRASTARL